MELTEEQLLNFCGEKLPQPFVTDGNRHYSDGHILVRVQGEGAITNRIAPGNEKEKAVRDVLNKPVCDATISLQNIEVVPKKFPCKHCKGTGKDIKCPECSGDGELTFTSSHNEYTVECDTCCGNGRVASDKDGTDCENCEGTGEVYEDEGIYVGLPHKLGITIIKKLQTLPNLKIYTTQVSGLVGCYYFEFDGGDGAVMGRMR